MIRQLVAALTEAGVEADAEDIANALWLARVRWDESENADRQLASTVRPLPTEPRPPDAEPQHRSDSAHATSMRAGSQGPERSAPSIPAAPGLDAAATPITLRRARA